MADIFDLNKSLVNVGKRFLPSEIATVVDVGMSPSDEPQRSYMWEMSFQDPFTASGGVFGLQGYADTALSAVSDFVKDYTGDFLDKGVDAVANYGKGIAEDFLQSGDATNLRYHLKSTAIPPIQHEVVTRHVGSVGYSYMGRDQSPKILRCTFWDTQSLDAYRFFIKWIQYAQYGDTKMKAHPVTYWRDVKIKLKDTSNLFTTQEFRFIGCMPTEITDAQLSYDNSDVFTFDVMFHFEKRVM